MRGAEELPHVVIVGGVLILVPHHKPDRGPGSLALEDSRQEFDPVALSAGSHQSRLSRTTPVELMLYKIHIDRYTGRHTVDNAPDGRAVRLAERGEREKISYRIHLSVYAGYTYMLYKDRKKVRIDNAPTKFNNPKPPFLSLRKLQAGQPIKEGGDCLIERSPRPVCDTAVIPADVHYSTSPKACFQIS